MIYLIHLSIDELMKHHTGYPNLNKKWIDNIVVQHLEVFMSQPLFNISLAPGEVVVHHKHL